MENNSVCAACAAKTHNHIVCDDCLTKGITVDMVKSLPNDALVLISKQIIEGKKKIENKGNLFILEMIDAILYPNSIRLTC